MEIISEVEKEQNERESKKNKKENQTQLKDWERKNSMTKK